MPATTQKTNGQNGTKRGFALASTAPIETIRAAAEEAPGDGYDSFWLNHPPNQRSYLPIATVARITNLTIGIGVIPLTDNPPQQIAFDIKEAGLPLDRLYLGIGSGRGPNGIERVQNGIRELRSLLKTRIAVAALGPKMVRLAGQEADAVLLNWLTPEYARTSVAWLREAAQAAGQPTPRIFAYVRVALGSASIERLQREAGTYTANPHYAAHFKRMGVPAAATAVTGDSAEDIQRGLDAWNGVVDEVVVRALPAHDLVEETVAILNAAKPG